LSEDADCDVRLAVADNPNTHIDVLAKLSKDEVRLIRKVVAGNFRTPAKILTELSEDNDNAVSGTATYELARRRK